MTEDHGSNGADEPTGDKGRPSADAGGRKGARGCPDAGAPTWWPSWPRPARPLHHWLLLLALVAMWGSSFLATKVAVGVLTPSAVVAARLAIAAAVLVAALVVTRARAAASWQLWGFFLAMAVVGNALPFWLISWGQQHIASALAGILMAVMPLATLMLAHAFVAGERLSPARVGGYVCGFAGIVVLLGPAALDQLDEVGGTLLAKLAVLAGALCYAVAAILARLRPTSDPLAAAAGVAVAATLVMAPVFLSSPTLQDRAETWAVALNTPAVAAVLFLGLISTALATIVYFKLVTVAGPSFLSLINYFIPLWAVGLGFVVLGERPQWTALAALALVLSGVALSELPPRRRKQSGQDTAPATVHPASRRVRGR